MFARLCLTSLCLFFATAPAQAGGDVRAGAQVFKKCGACHTATDPDNRVGPSLMGVIGRPVAAYAGYGYSAAMKDFSADGKVWDEALLSEYLIAPRAMVPGTKMSFAGLKKASDIENLIAYLKTTTRP